MKKPKNEKIRVTIEGALLDRVRRERDRRALPLELATFVRVHLAESLPADEPVTAAAS